MINNSNLFDIEIIMKLNTLLFNIIIYNNNNKIDLTIISLITIV